MKDRVRFAVLLLISFSLSTISESQKPVPPKAKTASVPVIKCSDPDSALACKSFKQLVDARDKEVLESVLGKKASLEYVIVGDKGNTVATHPADHASYVCFRPNTDTFVIVEFDQPRDGYFAYPITSELLSFFAFPVDKKPSVSPSTQQMWLDAHEDGVVYASGEPSFYLYQHGIPANLASDYGKWSRPAKPDPGESPSFEGAYSWLETLNLKNTTSSQGKITRSMGISASMNREFMCTTATRMATTV